MKLIRKAGSTSHIFQIFIQDSSSTTGAGLTGLVYNSGSMTAYYHRNTDTTATAMTLVTMTVGTFTSLGFKEIDATNMPGWYQFCPPDAAMAAGATSVGLAMVLRCLVLTWFSSYCWGSRRLFGFRGGRDLVRPCACHRSRHDHR